MFDGDEAVFVGAHVRTAEQTLLRAVQPITSLCLPLLVLLVVGDVHLATLLQLLVSATTKAITLYMSLRLNYYYRTYDESTTKQLIIVV